MSERADRYFQHALDAVRARDNDRALAMLVETIKLQPDHVEAWVLRGVVLHSTERHFDALLHFDRALVLDPYSHDAWNNRGIAFADIGMWDEAELSFKRSAELMPAVEPHIGLANMYCSLMRLLAAAGQYREAIAIDPGCIDGHFNLGVTLLGLGQWDEGFKEYELRWRNTPYPPRALRNYVKWRGENLDGKRILLYPEQGYGDEIMALRFAEAIRQRWDAFVMIQARAPVLTLAERMCERHSGMVAVASDRAGPIVADYSCPLLDVPMVLKLSWRDVHDHSIACGPYLQADRSVTADWRHRIAMELPPGLNVGLCWNSGTHLNTARAAQQSKSIPLSWLKPLGRVGVNLISLQKPHEKDCHGILAADWMDECHDFADTAALVEALDLVISVDTAVAHLAGATGKPVWNFVRYSGYWPWLAPVVADTPEQSIWYSSMKLLRQPGLGNWAEPINRAVSWLEAETKKAAA